MELFSSVVSGLATVSMFAVFLLYYIMVRRDSKDRNGAMWFSTALIMSCATFVQAIEVHGQVKDYLPQAVSSLLLFLMTIYLFRANRLSAVTDVDLGFFGLAVVSFVVWVFAPHDLRVVFITFALLTTFGPTIVGMIKGYNGENPWPWALGVLAYLLQMMGIVTAEEWQWSALALPFLNGVCGNGAVLVTIYCTQDR